jgi:serine/threonine protein kinase
MFVLKKLKNLTRLGRFRNEVEAGFRLEHSNVLRVVDMNLDDPKEPWYVSEYCAGGSLTEDARRTMTLEQKLDLFLSVCLGVAHAHDNAVVHRDIKPDNIFLRTKVGSPVIGDFGLCYLMDRDERLTSTREVVGSRWYCAPELEDGRSETLDPSADVYSLGKVLYWLMTGRTFAREKHRDPEYFFPANSNGSAGYLIYELLDRTIVGDPFKRFRTSAFLATAVKTIRQRIKMNAHSIGRSIPQVCTYCNEGIYQRAVDMQTGGAPYSANNFGINLVGDPTWFVLECDYCGNLQYFRLDEESVSKRWNQ